VLPDGKVFIAGGQVWGSPFNEETVQFYPEIYNPETDSFDVMNGQNIARVYHSISMLLIDGRVLNGGGGLCGNCTANHYDAQIFTPPYLLTASGELRERPTILRADKRVTVGGSLEFTADKHIASASLIRQGTTSHTVNTDQRRVPIEVEGHDGNVFTSKLPDDGGVMLPGYYMLFAMDAEGTPSEATMVKVELPEYATLELEEQMEFDGDDGVIEGHSAHEDHEGCDEEKMTSMLSSILSSPGRAWKSWRPSLVLQGHGL
jgi:galactose oxidase